MVCVVSVTFHSHVYVAHTNDHQQYRAIFISQDDRSCGVNRNKDIESLSIFLLQVNDSQRSMLTVQFSNLLWSLLLMSCGLPFAPHSALVLVSFMYYTKNQCLVYKCGHVYLTIVATIEKPQTHYIRYVSEFSETTAQPLKAQSFNFLYNGFKTKIIHVHLSASNYIYQFSQWCDRVLLLELLVIFFVYYLYWTCLVNEESE